MGGIQIGRGWVVLIVVLVVLVISVRLLDSPFRLFSYALLDSDTVVVEGVGAPGAWVHVTSVTEDADSVTISVSVFTFTPGPSADLGNRLGAIVGLEQPLGDRQVIDGATGEPVPRQVLGP